MFSLAIALVTIGCSSISDKRKNAHNAYQSADYDSAYSQFLELAEKGDSSSQFSLGIMYSEGKGVKKTTNKLNTGIA